MAEATMTYDEANSALIEARIALEEHLPRLTAADEAARTAADDDGVVPEPVRAARREAWAVYHRLDARVRELARLRGLRLWEMRQGAAEG